MASTRFINPDTLSKPPTYTQVVEVTGPGRTIYVSGQLAGDRDGKLVGRRFPRPGGAECTRTSRRHWRR